MNIEVTVCITTYNRKDTLIKAVKSVLLQTYSNFELLIIDDHSNDDTESFVRNSILPLDKKIKYIRHEVNQGLAKARNSAIHNAKGKYFTFCDDDDAWDPTFLEKFVHIAQQYDSTWCFCCGTRYFKNSRSLSIIYEMKGSLYKYISLGYAPPVAAQFYHTKELQKIGGYNIEIKSGVDHDLWLKLAIQGYNIYAIPEALAFPNTNASQVRMTTNTSRRKDGILESLQLWKNDIVKHFGLEFYIRFSQDYKDNLNIVSLKKALLSKNVREMWSIFKKINNKYKFIKFLIRSLNRKLFITNQRTIVDKGIFGD